MNNFRNTLGCHKHYLIVLAIISVVGFQNHSIWRDYQHKKPFQIIQDVSSYYAYLPGLFVHKSIFFKEPVSHDYWLRKGINGKNLPKFTMGMAFMYSPFFIAAHAFALHSEWFEADGLSYPYSLGLELGTFFYFAVGLFFLMKTLNFFFAKEIVSITILALFFGSNLLYYVLAKSEMPHAYLFSLFSVIIYLSHQIWDKGRTKFSYLVALLCGLAVLIRASELVFLFIPLFWNTTNLSEILIRIKLLFSKTSALIFHLICFALPIIPQLIYWKLATGHFIYNFYTNEGFFFTDPKLYDFLFSYRKGWFVYSPIMVFPFIAAFFLKRSVRQLSLILPIFMIVVTYILSSWWCWWYGGGLGMRAVVQYYALLAFPLAAIISYVYSKNWIKVLAFPILLGCIYYNLILTRQQQRKMLHWDGMTKEAYWNMFLKEFESDEEWIEHYRLIRSPDYDKAKSGEDRS